MLVLQDTKTKDTTLQKVPPLCLRLGRLPRLAVPKEEEATMKRKTKYPLGSPQDVLIRLRRIEADVRQMLTDIQSCNDNNPNFKDAPIDTGRYVVQLKKIRDVISRVEAEIAGGATKLPNEIMKPLCEEW